MDAALGAIFGRRVRVSGIMGGAVERVVEADEGERAGLATLFGLVGILKLRGVFELTHERGGVIGAKLRLEARVRQVCVVTLEAFDAGVREAVLLRFVPAAMVKEGAEVALDAEALEGPDEIYYGGDSIDLGAVTAEQLALALDPYPRSVASGRLSVVSEDEERESPFGVLRGLKGRGDGAG